MQLQLLGAASISKNGVLEPLPLARPAWLCLYLAMRGDWVARDELACVFRPEDSEETARNALRLIFHRAKQFDWAKDLEIEAKRARFVVKTDVADFKLLIQNKNWLEALELYKGGLLEGFAAPSLVALEAWLGFEREQLHGLWREAVLERVLELSAIRNYGVAISWLEKLLHIEPVCEVAIQHLMQSHLAQNNRLAAERVYQRFSRLLAEEFSLKPNAATTAILEPESQIKEVLPVLPKSNMPLFGRSTEIEQIKLGLLTDVRLLCLVGLGGSGKTRLALEAARIISPEFVHGTVFIDGTALQNPAQMPSALAAALQFKSSSNLELVPALLQYLEARVMLLVLDNLEHLLEVRSLIARILIAAPNIAILVTSRVRLAMQQETVLDVTGLALPQSQIDSQILQSDAVRYFLHVASRVGKFAIEPTLLAKIVWKLEGQPLAIELAARWTRVLSLAQIDSELQRGLLWLETDLHDLPMRHQSLMAVLNSTWFGLSERQKVALSAISVFRGGASLEALQAVAQIQLPTLLTLINSSLLHKDTNGRFYMHEMIRQFAAREAKNMIELMQSHWAYFYAPLRHVEGTYRPAELPQQYKMDLENLLAAWHWLIQHGNLQEISGLIARWVFVFEVHGWRDQAKTALNSANQHLRSIGESVILAQLLRAEAYFTYTPELAKICIEESITLYKHLENTAGIIEGLLKLAELEHGMGHFQAALSIFEAATTLATPNHSQILERMDYSLNELHRCLGNYPQARFFANRYTQKAIETNFTDGIGRGHHALGLIAQAEHQYQIAEQHFLESLDYFRQIGFQDGILSCLSNLGIAQMSQQRFADAKATTLETMRLKKELGRAVYVEHNVLGLMLLEQNQPDLAFEQSLLATELAVENHAIIFALDALKTVAQALVKLQVPLGKELLLQILNHPSTVAETRDAALKTWQSLEQKAPPKTEIRLIPELLFDLKQLALSAK